MTAALEDADSLWNADRRNEAIQILENYIPTATTEVIEDHDGKKNYVYRGYWLPSVIEKLRHFHYGCAQYVDPVTGLKATPSERIGHLNRIVELGFEFGYIFKFLAEAHHELGDDEEALACLIRAFKIDPGLQGAKRISRVLGFSERPPRRPTRST